MSARMSRVTEALRAQYSRPVDEIALRIIFRSLIVATVFVLGHDLYERSQDAPSRAAQTLLPGEKPQAEPFLPSVRPGVAKPGKERRASPEALRKEMTIELVSGGRLEATGAITPGTAARFKAEIEKRGDYVKTVVLNSPGGSVQDALEMSKLIREKRLNTLVPADAHCASSCPLVFAGGVAREAEKGASVGVHQVLAFSAPGVSGAAMQNSVQKISATCQRHLTEMGVDARVWVHAMETPPEELFYFTPKEMAELKLTTPPAPPVAEAKPPAKPAT